AGSGCGLCSQRNPRYPLPDRRTKQKTTSGISERRFFLLVAGRFVTDWVGRLLRYKPFLSIRAKKVFNTIVENAVEKYRCISVSGLARDVLAVCTAASAGTFWLRK
ncbi:MAG TPA: hypothetical protein VI386_20545, partial [Candidatus Sulfotelmatobacter sp.]